MNPAQPASRADQAGDPTEGNTAPRFLQIASDVAVLVLLFGTMLSSWALAAVAGTLFVGLLVYAWFSLDKAARNAFVLRALAVGVIAGGVAAVVALVSG